MNRCLEAHKLTVDGQVQYFWEVLWPAEHKIEYSVRASCGLCGNRSGLAGAGCYTRKVLPASHPC